MCYPTLHTIVTSSPVVVGTIIPSVFLLFPFISIGTMQNWCCCYRGGASGGLFVSTDSEKVFKNARTLEWFDSARLEPCLPFVPFCLHKIWCARKAFLFLNLRNSSLGFPILLGLFSSVAIADSKEISFSFSDLALHMLLKRILWNQNEHHQIVWEE